MRPRAAAPARGGPSDRRSGFPPPRLEGLYEIVLVAAAPPGGIEVTHDPRRRARLTAAERRAGARLLARRSRAAGGTIGVHHDARPPLYRLLAASAPVRRRITLRTGVTDYAEYVLTNVAHPEWRRRRGGAVMADPLSVGAVLVTRDGLALWGRRSALVLDHPRRAHILPSGHPHPPGTIAAGLFAELRDEVGLDRSEIASVICTGLVRSEGSGKPELSFLMRARLPWAEVRARRRVEAWEFSGIRTMRWEPGTVARWLERHRGDAVPVGHAAVLLAGRAAFGARWFEERLAALGRRAPRGRRAGRRSTPPEGGRPPSSRRGSPSRRR